MKRVCQFFLNGTFIHTYNSVAETPVPPSDYYTIGTKSVKLYDNCLWIYSDRCIKSENDTYICPKIDLSKFVPNGSQITIADPLFRMKDNSFKYTPNLESIVDRSVCKFTHDCVFVQYYNSPEEASNSTGVSKSRILDCASRRQRTTRDGIWRYSLICVKLSNSTYSLNQEDMNEIDKKRVCKFNLNGSFVAVYNSCKDAALSEYKSYATRITECLNGERDEAYNHKWKKACDCIRYENGKYSIREIVIFRF